jgi:transcription elongation factor Elf1
MPPTGAARRRFLQNVLQSGKVKSAREDELFGCPRCHARYTIIRRETPPGMIPVCEDCAQEFQLRDEAGWLVYERVTSD